MPTDKVPQQRTTTSMGRVRPVHGPREHEWREDGTCACGKHDLAKVRAHRRLLQEHGHLLRDDNVPAQPTARRYSLDKIEQNAGLDGDIR